MVVRGLVRRVVRGVGSVGSPRSGGQFFQLSHIFNARGTALFLEFFLPHRKRSIYFGRVQET